jgi:PilZ domain-containing protein
MCGSQVYAALELREIRSRRLGLRKEGSLRDVPAEPGKETTPQAQADARYEDMQGAPRFPLHLPVSVRAEDGAHPAETQNISANGVLFAMDSDVPVGSLVDFTILLPGDVVGSVKNVQIDCRGRVIRSFEDGGRRGVGVVIDEYHFERS